MTMEGLESSSLLADHAFDGPNTPEAVQETTINILTKTIQDERSYQELADATDCDARKLHPLPWLNAVEHVAECNGYGLEPPGSALGDTDNEFSHAGSNLAKESIYMCDRFGLFFP